MTLEEAYQRLKLQVDLVPAGKKNRPGTTLTPTHITIHNTDNPSKGADALMHGKFIKNTGYYILKGKKHYVSWHFSVDDKRAVKHIPTREQAFHAKAGNSKSVGVEICMNEGIDHAAANERAALLTAVLMDALQIPVGNVVPHKHWTGKECPSLLLANGASGWNSFIAMVRAFHEQLTGHAGLSTMVLRGFDPAEDLERGEDEVSGVALVDGNVYRLNARPDTPDFRDMLFEATLTRVPVEIPLAQFTQAGVEIRNQGVEGACTGFGLAAVVDYLYKTRPPVEDTSLASARMLYEMARRYDEWPGESYSGSSARGAMKGWQKHGVCSEEVWPFRIGEAGELTDERSSKARQRPLGAYYRVNHKDLVCMHCAIAEVGALYATARVHTGWQKVGGDGRIQPSSTIIGGHAFAIVGYDREGFWIQNSWGTGWGNGGFGHISYDDWLANGTDVWVARLGVPVRSGAGTATNALLSGGFSSGPNDVRQLRRHIIALGNNGLLSNTGLFANTTDTVRTVFEDFKDATKGWSNKRLVLYAHGGLVPEAAVVQQIGKHFQTMLDNEAYPIAFIWHTDLLTTLKNILEDALQVRRADERVTGFMDFMFDRLDDLLEPIARSVGGRSVWSEMKENAELATTDDEGGARLVAELIRDLVAADPSITIHLVGHSAGSIFFARFAELLSTKGVIERGPMMGENGFDTAIDSCTFWAPAVTTELFKEAYLPLIAESRIARPFLYTLTDKAEQDDNCIGIYHKSLLYLVSNAFEDQSRIPGLRGGTPLLGMEKFVLSDVELRNLYRKQMNWFMAPGGQGPTGQMQSSAIHHGDFDDDDSTLVSTLEIITGKPLRVAALAHPSTDRIERGRELARQFAL